MTNPVFKIAETGKSIESTDIRDFVFHSNYSCFKLHSIESGSISISAGGTTGTTTISHSLGYIPAFLVYEYDGSSYKLFPSGVNCYATTTGITITKILSSPYDQVITTYTANQAAFEDSTESFNIIAGKKVSSGTGSAVRFENIIVSQGQTINSANFEWKSVETTATSDIKFKIWGIDQDNCSSFSDYGDAGSRPRTDTVNTKVQSANTSEFNFGDNWTSLAQEIVNRAGWSSGNDMGFVFNDNGTDNSKVIGISKSYGVDKIELTINLTGTATLIRNYKVVVFKDKIA